MISKNNKQLIEKLVETNSQNKTAFEEVADKNSLILSRFTHELRNPLTLVKSTIQLIESQHPEVTEFKYWNQLMSDIDDTVSLLNELSLYNHCDTLCSEDTDFLKLVSASVESMKPLALTKNVNIAFSKDHFTSIYQSYFCDKLKIKQTLRNLLKNAVEAAFEDSIIHVDLSLTQSPKADCHYICLSITNQGSPISLDHMNSIFEPFVTTKSTGSGLGLAISKKIAELHQGQLSASQTDNTVTFTLQLPVNVAEMDSLAVAP